jgi:hypothetical protein
MGRVSVLLVIGTSFMFLFVNRNLNDVGLEALRNAINYYENTMRYNVAVAGANFSCSEIFRAPNWRTGFNNISFNGGTFSVSVTDLGVSNRVQILSTGTYEGVTQTVTVVLQPSYFSKFGYYGGTHASSAAWETGDTVAGPNHTQGTLYTTGSPVFLGKTTSKTGLVQIGAGNPQFVGGYETGVSLPMPNNYNNIDSAAVVAGHKYTGGNLYLHFISDGTVKVIYSGTVLTYPINWTPVAPVAVSTLTSNGVVNVLNGNLYVEGVVNGRVTLAATRSSSGGSNGNITIMNDLTYANNPVANPNSTDLAGLVSYGDITVRDNSATSFKVQGSLYSYTGGFAVENYNSRPSGVLSLLGGFIVDALYATSNGGSGASRRGYNLSVKYDDRLAATAPPAFPATGNYEIVSWLE